MNETNNNTYSHVFIDCDKDYSDEPLFTDEMIESIPTSEKIKFINSHINKQR